MAKRDFREQSVLKGVEPVQSVQALITYVFPNIDGKGTKMSVQAKNMEEALKIARRGVTK